MCVGQKITNYNKKRAGGRVRTDGLLFTKQLLLPLSYTGLLLVAHF